MPSHTTHNSLKTTNDALNGSVRKSERNTAADSLTPNPMGAASQTAATAYNVHTAPSVFPTVHTSTAGGLFATSTSAIPSNSGAVPTPSLFSSSTRETTNSGSLFGANKNALSESARPESSFGRMSDAQLPGSVRPNVFGSSTTYGAANNNTTSGTGLFGSSATNGTTGSTTTSGTGLFGGARSQQTPGSGGFGVGNTRASTSR